MHKLHEGHQGIFKCRAWVQASVWWPGISAQIQETVNRCEICQRYRTQYREPLIQSHVPDRPWQKVGMDLLDWANKTYLLIIDYFSRYIELAKLRATSSEATVHAVKEAFAHHGYRETVLSNNGPQFSSETFRTFANESCFAHFTNSPHYPQANGEAEHAVQTVPVENWTNQSAFSVQSHTIRTWILICAVTNGEKPAHIPPSIFKSADIEAFQRKDEEGWRKQATHYNLHHRSRTLQELTSGENVSPQRKLLGLF